MTKIDTGFADEIKKYGAKDFDACYNCGNCTAVCELTDKNANFPRMMIRYGMLGQKEEILKSKELWLCYACGDCSDKCPRQAAPGDYMSALRRYAIANFEPTGLTKLIFKSNFLYIVITLLLAITLGFFLLTLNTGHEVARWIFKILPYGVIHNTGIVIFIMTGISVVWGLINMWIKLNKNEVKKDKPKHNFFESLSYVINEMWTMKRYKNCDEEEDSFWKSKLFLQKPWFIHWSIMWGFIGLLVATTLDFVFKDPATDIWFPARILGTIGGILLVYGASLALVYRRNKITKAYAETKLADWVFLLFLWIAGITGFWLEIAVTFNSVMYFNHIVLLIHTIISMELVLLFAFSKFAHAVYRPLALFYYH